MQNILDQLNSSYIVWYESNICWILKKYEGFVFPHDYFETLFKRV